MAPWPHSLEDLSVLPQQRFQVGIAQGPVEAVPIPLGLADGGEPFAKFLRGREGNVDVCNDTPLSCPVRAGSPPRPGCPPLPVSKLSFIPQI